MLRIDEGLGDYDRELLARAIKRLNRTACETCRIGPGRMIRHGQLICFSCAASLRSDG